MSEQPILTQCIARPRMGMKCSNTELFFVQVYMCGPRECLMAANMPRCGAVRSENIDHNSRPWHQANKMKSH